MALCGTEGGMSRQYNKGIKRQRRNAYLKRRKKAKRAK
jgi:hypothetical protein